jgi:hypothetical protein
MKELGRTLHVMEVIMYKATLDEDPLTGMHHYVKLGL